MNLGVCGHRITSNLSLAFAASLLLGCTGGGNGGGNGGGGQTGNSVPIFTSPTSASVPENSGGIVYQATATDADGNVLNFTISGGADAGRLQISSTGAVRFNGAPDFETPLDANGDNVYEIQIAANDGQAVTLLSVSITITDKSPGSFAVRRIQTGFNVPVFLAPMPDGSGRVFVVEQAGIVRILNPNTGGINATNFLDISLLVLTAGQRGLLGFTPAPDYATSGDVYVYFSRQSGTMEVRRYTTMATDPDRADPNSGDIILTISQPESGHEGGWIGFGPNGLLYITSGDGGSQGDTRNFGQNVSNLHSAILRIDVTGDDFPGDPNRDYAIPFDNPFAGGGGAPEIWTYGFRNPFRGSFDSLTGNLLIGDVGQDTIEEIDLMRPDDRGANFGWSILEGTLQFKPGSTAGMTPPAIQYFHGTAPTQGNSVTGGYVYRGPIESLRGHYVFADFQTPNIWSVPIADIQVGTTIGADQFVIRTAEFAPDVGTYTNIVSFGVDEFENLYLVDIDGEIYRVELDE